MRRGIKGKKGKGLSTCYSAIALLTEARTATLYNLGSGSWLAWADHWHNEKNCTTIVCSIRTCIVYLQLRYTIYMDVRLYSVTVSNTFMYMQCISIYEYAREYIIVRAVIGDDNGDRERSPSTWFFHGGFHRQRQSVIQLSSIWQSTCVYSIP